MDRQAKVTSVDALTSLRSSLVLYISSVTSALDDVRDEVRRTRSWIQVEQKALWMGKIKRLRKQLEQAESELFTSRLSAMTSHSAARQMAVTRLRRQVRETEEKAALVKKWNKNYDNLVSPLVKKLDSISFVITNDLPKAVAFLSQAEASLDAYTRIAPETDLGGGGGAKSEGDGAEASEGGEES